MSTRREIVIALAACTAAPRLVFAQQKVWRVGFLSLDHEDGRLMLDGLRRGLRERGLVEGRDFQFDVRMPGDRYEQLPDAVNELIALNVNVIVTYGTTALRVAAKATKTVPIVIGTASIDVVANGLAMSLSHPGGNITGLVSQIGEIQGKRLQLLKEILPGLHSFGFLVNPESEGGSSTVGSVRAAARSLNLGLQTYEVHDATQLELVFSEMARARVTAVFVAPSTMFLSRHKAIVNLAAKYRLPTVYQRSEYVDVGGLMAYGPNLPHSYRNIAIYVERVLKGAKPGGIPIEQSTKFDLVLNIKTAKALGIAIPDSIRLQATRVIE